MYWFFQFASELIFIYKKIGSSFSFEISDSIEDFLQTHSEQRKSQDSIYCCVCHWSRLQHSNNMASMFQSAARDERAENSKMSLPKCDQCGDQSGCSFHVNLFNRIMVDCAFGSFGIRASGKFPCFGFKLEFSFGISF